LKFLKEKGFVDADIDKVFDIELFEREEAKRANAESASKNKIVEGVTRLLMRPPTI
jgi:hypothetical protein